MKTNKVRVIQDFEKLNSDIQEQIKLVYPNGFSQHLIEFKNKNNETVYALPFETDEKMYMVRMSVRKAIQLIEDDEDYDDDGNLRDDIREKYEEDHSEVDYLSENDNYDDGE
jgi:hypothetical protein